MPSARVLVSASLLLLAALSVAPAASADEVWACYGIKPEECEGNAVLVVEHNGGRVLDVCVIAVAGSCDPYSGHLVRAHLYGQEITVPDPCYTTACF
jgi:hypothetical protein